VRSQCPGGTSEWSGPVTFTTLTPPPSRPNILFILLDDARFDVFQPNGGPAFFNTPAINSIAEEGANFRYMFATNSVCVPSRCSFYTGHYSHTHGAIENNVLVNPAFPMIQEVLQQHGYYTGLVGRYGQPYTPRGFDWYASMNNVTYINPQCNLNDTSFFPQGHTTDIMTDFALEFLATVDTPFLLMYLPVAPHYPTIPREQEADLFTADEMPFPSNFARRTSNYPSWLYESGLFTWFNDSTETDSANTVMFQTLMGVEHSVDTMLNWLRSRGMLDNTLVVFSSDNGFMMGEHKLSQKRMAYEESFRLPLFIRYPAWFTPGTVVENELAANIDFFSTALDAAGIADTFGTAGISWRQLGNGERHRDLIFYEYPGITTIVPPFRAVRTPNYKFIRSYCDSLTEELYDLVADPAENVNLINNASFAGVVSQYRSMLDSMRNLLGDVEVVNIDCSLLNPQLSKEEGADEQKLLPAGELTVYPNPASDHFFLQHTGSRSGTVITITNALGKIAFRNVLADSDVSLLKINCRDWNRGVYYVSSGDETRACKIILQ
jgi:N-acetylglucosamine-6-sulfatase